MHPSTRHHLLLIALAQRSLSIALAIFAGVFILGVLAVGFAGPAAEYPVKGIIIFSMFYITAATYHLSRSLGDPRGLRFTLALITLFVPLAILIVPFILLWRARRRLRDHAIEAGFFSVRRSDFIWLRAEPDTPTPCLGCGYELTGLPEHALCPECGRARA